LALEKWESDWQMDFHPQKCTMLCICDNKRHRIDTTYMLHQHILAREESSKYLAVTVSDNLTWRKHVNATAEYGNRTLELETYEDVLAKSRQILVQNNKWSMEELLHNWLLIGQHSNQLWHT